VLWKGFQQLVEITAMYQSMRPRSLAASPVHQNKNSGEGDAVREGCQAAPCVLAYLCCVPASAILCKGYAVEKTRQAEAAHHNMYPEYLPSFPSGQGQFGGFDEQ
jgi:hypothetical protein